MKGHKKIKDVSRTKGYYTFLHSTLEDSPPETSTPRLSLDDGPDETERPKARCGCNISPG